MNSIRLLLITLIFSVQSVWADKPYVMPKLTGQLGNQLFQIAAATSLALDNGAKVIVPELKYLQEWEIPTNRNAVLWRVDVSDPDTNISYYYDEPTFTYSPIPYYPNMRIQGYFQSEKYFAKYKKEIIELFSPHEYILHDLQTRYSEIIFNENTVSIHVRTYMQNDPNHQWYHLNGRKYVEKAMAFFPYYSSFIIFSDNIPWCKQHLRGLRPHMRFIEGDTHYNDFFLMSMCRHNIISNSSFSWWAAYLNKNPDKIVIAPKNWFTERVGANTSDLIPKEWLMIE